MKDDAKQRLIFAMDVDEFAEAENVLLGVASRTIAEAVRVAVGGS